MSNTGGATVRRQVSVIFTVLNEGEALRALLDSLEQQSRFPDQVVVVDGGSTDGTVSVLEDYRTRLPLEIVVEQGANISRGRNVAIHQAAHDLIAVTDAGVRLEKDWLEKLVAPFESSASPDFVSGFFLPEPEGLFEHALAMATLPAREEMGRGRFMPSSRSVAFTRAIWAKVGGYPEWMRWSEDVLFDLAIMNSGANIVYQPDAVAWFRPRQSLAAFARQYRNYAFGDGQGLLWPKRHAIRYLTYFVILPLAIILLKRRPAWGVFLLAFGGMVMFGTPVKRHWRSGRYRWSALPLLPLIRVVGDLAKIWGFPQAVGVGWRNRRVTRDYLMGRGRRGAMDQKSV